MMWTGFMPRGCPARAAWRQGGSTARVIASVSEAIQEPHRKGWIASSLRSSQ
jgi:hypothetical protein